MISLPSILSEMIKSVNSAQKVLLEFVEDGYETQYKSGMDPVTTADYAVDKLLNDELMSKFPDFGWLSEETKDDFGRLDCDYVWMVDPIDGTREFVANIPEFTISVALLKNNSPVLGVIANPSTNEMFTTIKDEGSKLNGKKISVRTNSESNATVIVSRIDEKNGVIEKFRPYVDFIPCGSIAYKLARVAKGEVDAAVTFHPVHEWDIAAGVLLLEEAGGIVHDLDGNTFTFNRPKPFIPSIIGTNKSSNQYLSNLFKK